MEDRHDRIRRRAFEIWEREGRPGDEPEVYWYRAESEIDEAERASASSDDEGGAVAGGDEVNVEEIEKAPTQGGPARGQRPRKAGLEWPGGRRHRATTR